MCPTSRDTTLYFVVRPRAVEIVSDLQLHDPLASAGGLHPQIPPSTDLAFALVSEPMTRPPPVMFGFLPHERPG